MPAQVKMIILIVGLTRLLWGFMAVREGLCTPRMYRWWKCSGRVSESALGSSGGVSCLDRASAI